MEFIIQIAAMLWLTQEELNTPLPLPGVVIEEVVKLTPEQELDNVLLMFE